MTITGVRMQAANGETLQVEKIHSAYFSSFSSDLPETETFMVKTEARHAPIMRFWTDAWIFWETLSCFSAGIPCYSFCTHICICNLGVNRPRIETGAWKLCFITLEFEIWLTKAFHSIQLLKCTQLKQSRMIHVTSSASSQRHRGHHPIRSMNGTHLNIDSDFTVYSHFEYSITLEAWKDVSDPISAIFFFSIQAMTA